MVMRTYIVLLCVLVGKMGVTYTSELWQSDQDLLSGCSTVQQTFDADTQTLTDLETAFNNVCTILVNLAQQRNAFFAQYEQQISDYQALLAQEQNNLVTLQTQGTTDTGTVQDQIDQLTEQSNDEITQLQTLIAQTQQAIQELQENLATITNMNQDSVTTVQDMLQSYANFEAVRGTFGDQVNTFVSQVNSYVSTVSTNAPSA